MKVALIVSHGSRSKDFQEGFKKIVELAKEKSDEKLYYANMELCEPSIETTVEKIIKENENLSQINLVPFFLFEGIHIKEDIPEIIEGLKEKYTSINFKMGKPIGADPLLADILLKRIEEMN